MKKEKEKSCAFVSIGKVAIVVSNNIAPYLDSILVNIKESLILKGLFCLIIGMERDLDR